MSGKNGSRRNFLGAAVAAPALGAVALADPGRAAAQAAGIKRADLPDLTIKQVKVLVLKPEERRPPAMRRSGRARRRGGAAARRRAPGEKFAAIVTNSGIEGNYILDGPLLPSQLEQPGWLEYAKAALPGKSVLDLPALTSQWRPSLRRYGQLSYAAAIDNCCWDILGKAVGLPVYRILGALPRPRSRLRQFAASADRRGFRGRREARHVRRLHGLQNPPAGRRRLARLQARHGGHQGRPADRRETTCPCCTIRWAC